jgi:Ca2+-binding EF-hand superfamily protein
MADRDREALAARQWQAQRRSPERRQASRRRSPERPERSSHAQPQLYHDEGAAAPAPSAPEQSLWAGDSSSAAPTKQAPMTASYAAAAAQAAVAQAAELRTAAAAASPTGEPKPANLDDACLKLDDVLGRVGAALRAVNDQYLDRQAQQPLAEPAAPTAAPAAAAGAGAGRQALEPANAADEEARALAELAGLDSRLGEVQSRAVKAQEEQRRWRQFFMRADVGGRGTAHRDDLLALLSSSGLSITGSASSTSVEMLRQALASSDETVTLQQFMAQIRVATAATDDSPSPRPAYTPAQNAQVTGAATSAAVPSGHSVDGQASYAERAVGPNSAVLPTQPQQAWAAAPQEIAPTVSAVSMVSAPVDGGGGHYGNGAVANAVAAPLARLDLPSEEERDELFRRWDYNGSGALSFAEIDKAVVERYPHFDHKPSLTRAYRAADVNGDGVIKLREFHLLLKYLVYFTDLWDIFDAIDTTHDHRLSYSEFLEAAEKLRLDATAEELEQEFIAMDMRDGGGGFVPFDEFSRWCAQRHIDSGLFDGDNDLADGRGDDGAAVAAPHSAATPPAVGLAREQLQAVLSDERHGSAAYDIEALRLAFAMYCESSGSVGKTKWMTSPKFMRMMRDSGVIRTRHKPSAPEAWGAGGSAAADTTMAGSGSPKRSAAARAARSLGPAGLPKAQVDVIFAKALRIGKQRDGPKGPATMVNGNTLGFDGFVFALHSLAVQLFFPGADLHSVRD